MSCIHFMNSEWPPLLKSIENFVAITPKINFHAIFHILIDYFYVYY